MDWLLTGCRRDDRWLSALFVLLPNSSDFLVMATFNFSSFSRTSGGRQGDVQPIFRLLSQSSTEGILQPEEGLCTRQTGRSSSVTILNSRIKRMDEI